MSGWPTSFPLLPQTKQMAAEAPMPSGLTHELAKAVLPGYYIEPGDRILVEPIDLESKLGSFGDQKVQVDGTIDLGKFGRMRVAGMQVEEIESAIEDRIASSGTAESINVQLTETNAAEVYVLGEVGSPAAYPIDGHEHVLDAILRAGGVTSKASPCDIILVRPTAPGECRVVLPVCYRQITQVGDVTTNYQLQPGDRIVVGARSRHEEFAFWKQNKACDRCCGSCCVECQPSNVQYSSRFGAVAQWLGRPAPIMTDSPPIQIQETGVNPEPGTGASPSEKTKVPDASRDDDLFLPPTNFSDGKLPN